MRAVQFRTIAVSAGLALLCSACANEPLGSAPMQLGAGSKALTVDTAPSYKSTGVASAARRQPSRKYRKTMSDKMLAASALERATGRKPHPTRFRDID